MFESLELEEDKEIRPDINVSENEQNEGEPQFEARVLESRADREMYRSVLAQIEAEAFKNDPDHQDGNVNLMSDIPDSMYFDSRNYIVVLEDPDTKLVEGFSFLEPREADTYYETITCVLHSGKGYGTKILDQRDAFLRKHGVKNVVTHVEKEGKYAKALMQRYSQEELRENDSKFMNPKQVALRLKIGD